MMSSIWETKLDQVFQEHHSEKELDQPRPVDKGSPLGKSEEQSSR